ncbi:MAG: PQQ-dependent sugar dehydrogenase [Flavobacteriales bacterium]|nr:PQQ-dependent sugar dehydrogenase [Flavobacteriales bacterium]
MKIFTLLIVLLLYSFDNYCQPQIALTSFAVGFSSPVDIANCGDDRLFIVEQDGVIKIVQPSGTVNSVVFLDIQAIVNNGGSEQGLLGLAFHPNYSSNGYFYVHYTDNSGDGQISRFNVNSTNPDIADNGSEYPILTIPQPYSNHNGGCIKFGPDNYLYIGMGDGGSAGDPGNRSQDPTDLLGKMLRIDIDGGAPYGIPASNPYLGVSGWLDEIWAIGLRNPWRFSFDALNGDLWMGDVGQNAWEEINQQLSSSAGGENYGWRCYEASASYNTSGCSSSSSDFEWPIYEFSQSGSPPNGCSVTGGIVYRGAAYPNLNGHYLFSDFCGSWIYSLKWWSGSLQSVNHGSFSGGFSCFGEDYLGESYVAGLYDGVIYSISDLHNEINENMKLNKFSVYPNPFNNNVTIRISEDYLGEFDVLIYDVAGQLVYSDLKFKGQELILNSLSWEKGLYLLKIVDDRGSCIGQQKIINQ